MLRKRVRKAGFTLIELAVGLAVVSILLVMGMPTLMSVLDSARIRSAASGFNAGVQFARAQAISKNVAVDFIPVKIGGALTPGWTVRYRVPPPLPEPQEIESRPVQEGSAQTVQVGNNASGVESITFNGLGAAVFRDSAGAAVTGVNPVVFSFSLPTVACAANGGQVRCLDVRVSTAGQNRLCDPVAVAGDTRAC